ncbi:hypothetical protein PIB30_046949 [Stylosanthes scabra]|uniref:Uncharacterized protein n=1 Tax=Stylosanthes scabra TaxID=79078 RepID=A0ABU6QG76_9FABA|nr:hypothetical protein [Stylosanthes scabra]
MANPMGHGNNLIETYWENVEQFLKLFPDFNLEDKVVLDGGSNDMSKGRIEHVENEHARVESNSVTTELQMAVDPKLSGMRRSNRMKVPNSKYSMLTSSC